MLDDGSPVLFRRAGRGFDRRFVRRIAMRLRAEVAGGRSFTCLLAGDSELRRLNRRFLDRDYPTDVLSFPEQAPNRQSPADPLGEIAISVDRARQQAAEHGHSVEDEIGILMLHGLLHLVGYDHERDRGRMAAAERQWRERLGLPSGLIERAKRS